MCDLHTHTCHWHTHTHTRLSFCASSLNLWIMSWHLLHFVTIAGQSYTHLWCMVTITPPWFLPVPLLAVQRSHCTSTSGTWQLLNTSYVSITAYVIMWAGLPVLKGGASLNSKADIHSKNKDALKLMAAVSYVMECHPCDISCLQTQVAGQPELNFNNSTELLTRAVQVRRRQFLRTFYQSIVFHNWKSSLHVFVWMYRSALSDNYFTSVI